MHYSEWNTFSTIISLSLRLEVFCPYKGNIIIEFTFFQITSTVGHNSCSKTGENALLNLDKSELCPVESTTATVSQTYSTQFDQRTSDNSIRITVASSASANSMSSTHTDMSDTSSLYQCSSTDSAKSNSSAVCRICQLNEKEAGMMIKLEASHKVFEQSETMSVGSNRYMFLLY